MSYLGEFGVIRGIGYSVAIVVTAIALGASFGSGVVPKQRHIEITYPDLGRLNTQPCSAEDPTPCAAEAAALAAALAHLDTAREVAEEAFQAWSDCVDANGGPNPNPDPNPNPSPRTVGLTSVLEAVK